MRDNDITTRLRKWTTATDAVPCSDLMDEAADFIDSLRKEIRTQRNEIALLRSERDELLSWDDPPEADKFPT